MENPIDVILKKKLESYNPLPGEDNNFDILQFHSEKRSKLNPEYVLFEKKEERREIAERIKKVEKFNNMNLNNLFSQAVEDINDPSVQESFNAFLEEKNYYVSNLPIFKEKLELLSKEIELLENPANEFKDKSEVQKQPYYN